MGGRDPRPHAGLACTLALLCGACGRSDNAELTLEGTIAGAPQAAVVVFVGNRAFQARTDAGGHYRVRIEPPIGVDDAPVTVYRDGSGEAAATVRPLGGYAALRRRAGDDATLSIDLPAPAQQP